MRNRLILPLASAWILCVLSAVAADAPPGYTRWKNGPPTSDDYFPLAVWLQAPHNAAKYKALGINLYVGLWTGPDDEQLATLEKAGIQLICHQNDAALKSANARTIVGWMHGDEPDNAQELPNGKGYGPPIEPQKIVADYEKLRAADPSRPIFLNLGQGVAWDAWIGRGVRSNKPEDYPEYVKGGDIVSFDIYPTSHDHKDVAGKLEFVPRGVERLVKWTERAKPVWCCIETTQISNPGKMPTPQAVRSQVWMALIHGARGIIYFAHQFKPKFIEAGLLAHPEIVDAVKNINAEVKSLAPVLNAPDVSDAVEIAQPKDAAPVAFLVKRHGGFTYVFAVNMRPAATRATFTVKGEVKAVEAINEKRPLELSRNSFSDEFQGYAVHLYRITP